jgi:AcrR family transcriptional regulator
LDAYPERTINPDPVWEEIRLALMGLVLERGYRGTSRSDVLERAGIGEDAFDQRFQSFDDCFRQVATAHIAYFESVVVGAYEAGEGWRDALRAMAYAAAWFFEANPRICLFANTQDVPPMIAAERDAILQRLVDAVDDGRHELPDPDSKGRAVAEGAVGAIQSRVITGIGSGDVTSARAFVPELMYLAVRPYLGHEVAQEELSIPPPPE